MWSAVISALDQSGLTGDHRNGVATVSVAARLQSPSRAAGGSRWRTVSAYGLIGLAQAAAILLAVALSWDTPSRTVTHRKFTPAADLAQRTLPSLDSVVEAEDGQVLYIRSEGPSVQIIDLTSLEAMNGEDPWFVFFNFIEPGQMIAMQ
jgi:hypothetical protein